MHLHISQILAHSASLARENVPQQYHIHSFSSLVFSVWVEAARGDCDTCGVGRVVVGPPTASPASWARVCRGCLAGTNPCDAPSRVMRRQSASSCGRRCAVWHGRVELWTSHVYLCVQGKWCIISSSFFSFFLLVFHFCLVCVLFFFVCVCLRFSSLFCIVLLLFLFMLGFCECIFSTIFPFFCCVFSCFSNCKRLSPHKTKEKQKENQIRTQKNEAPQVHAQDTCNNFTLGHNAQDSPSQWGEKHIERVGRSFAVDCTSASSCLLQRANNV